MPNEITVGDKVRFAEILDPGDDECEFEVIEDNGDRLLIRMICDLPIRPVMTVLRRDVQEGRPMLTIGSLFAGIGGFELGLERTGGFKTEWQVEIESCPLVRFSIKYDPSIANQFHRQRFEVIMSIHMSLASADIEIVGPVVGFYPVDVMNNLAFDQFATRRFFDHKNVLGSVGGCASMAGSPDHDVAIRVNKCCSHRGNLSPLGANAFKPPSVAMPAKGLMANPKRASNRSQGFSRSKT